MNIKNMAYWHAKNSPTKHPDTDAHNKKFGEGHSSTAEGHPQTDKYGIPFDWAAHGTDPSGPIGQQILKRAEMMKIAELKKSKKSKTSKAAKKKDE